MIILMSLHLNLLKRMMMLYLVKLWSREDKLSPKNCILVTVTSLISQEILDHLNSVYKRLKIAVYLKMKWLKQLQS